MFLVLDKAVCPFLVKYFDMLIWHPTCEKTLDNLLDTEADLGNVDLSRWQQDFILVSWKRKRIG